MNSIPGQPTLNIVLYAPRIAQNTGQIARTCYAMGLSLHLIRPLGFRVDSHSLRRAGVGYWDELAPTIHADREAFLRQVPDAGRIHLVTKHGQRDFTQVQYQPGDWIILGNETEGLPEDWLGERSDRTVVIPMPNSEARCLNVSVAATAVIFEALRQIGSSA